MTLTAKDVAEIARLVEESSFDELTLELDGLKLSLRRNGAGAHPAHPDEGLPPAVPVPGAPVAPSPPAAAAGEETLNVTAPLLGTFYRAAKPGAPPFVEVGAAVEADTIIGIIEVMKLMNTVRAGARGTVVEVVAQDGALVEYGETLLRLSKASEA